MWMSAKSGAPVEGATIDGIAVADRLAYCRSACGANGA